MYYYENQGQDNIADFNPPVHGRAYTKNDSLRVDTPTFVIREYETGATRDTRDGKLCYIGFLSAKVLRRFAEYMEKNRIQSDGALRSPDNWKKGIPVHDYLDSMSRHMMDLLFFIEAAGCDEAKGEYVEELLCAIMFNTMGMLFEVLR